MKRPMQTSSRKQEAVIYAVIWLLLFTLPVAVIQFHHSADATFPWGELLNTWQEFAVFFVAFLLHNYLLAPLLVYKRRHVLYFSLVAGLLTCFVLFQCVHRPALPHDGHGHEQAGHRSPMMHEPDDDFMPLLPPDFDEEQEPHPDHGPRQEHADEHPPVIFGQHDFIATIVLVLMLGMNLGVKLYFRQRDDERRMADLERKNLEQQLEFLRYQINPHFLMNTLNNIHALVDIEPEQAKEAIVGLSKILRFVLYEGSKQMVPLDREMGFLSNYIELMGMRVADQVDMMVELPASMPDVQVPPLLFITFVENAFKHGVSYQQRSFIDIRCSVEDGRLVFACRNSKVRQEQKKSGGVGLQNARKRLDLIYADRYQLDITQDDQTYSVLLTIPLQSLNS